ncbi:MAG: DNA-directed RNA polymerase subunit omega [Fretibacterium sp.]|nr:DNA-directed RNA polymerase subunit omega [Fretibacterium sp.]
MKFYDLVSLASKCGTDNKYEITALVASRARWLSEIEELDENLPANEKYLSRVLLELEENVLPPEWIESLRESSGESC